MAFMIWDIGVGAIFMGNYWETLVGAFELNNVVSN
jgi:hypothetical protein